MEEPNSHVKTTNSSLVGGHFEATRSSLHVTNLEDNGTHWGQRSPGLHIQEASSVPEVTRAGIPQVDLLSE